jgi:hypothetical protein
VTGASAHTGKWREGDQKIALNSTSNGVLVRDVEIFANGRGKILANAQLFVEFTSTTGWIDCELMLNSVRMTLATRTRTSGGAASVRKYRSVALTRMFNAKRNAYNYVNLRCRTVGSTTGFAQDSILTAVFLPN